MQTEKNSSKNNKERRLQINTQIIDFEKAASTMVSQRAASKEAGIPRSTARDRIARKEMSNLDKEVQSFFESPAGMAFLHRVVLAAEVTITQLANGGLRILQLFLELSHIDQWAASSRGSLQERVKTMENNTIEFGEQQDKALANGMPHKIITVCLDETFPSGICLVAIEPKSL